MMPKDDTQPSGSIYEKALQNMLNIEPKDEFHKMVKNCAYWALNEIEHLRTSLYLAKYGENNSPS